MNNKANGYETPEYTNRITIVFVLRRCLLARVPLKKVTRKLCKAKYDDGK